MRGLVPRIQVFLFRGSSARYCSHKSTRERTARQAAEVDGLRFPLHPFYVVGFRCIST
jgi:hypothetical protein